MGQKQSKEILIEQLKKMASNGQLLPDTKDRLTVKQWVKNVTGFSSQYDSNK